MHIGPIQLRNAVALAPMAGFSDVPFRELAWQMGAGYLVSEMVSAKPELWETGKSRQRRIPIPGVHPQAVQIAGSDPQQLAEGARRHVDDGVDVIDINFGCPAKKVCRKAAGSALLADSDHIARCVEAVANAVPVPVTIKTRTGLVPGDGLGFIAARKAVSAGAVMVVLHGRSRACRFVGKVEHETAASLKATLGVPVLANGDIASRADARAAIKASDADGVMIGRAAIGRPWLFAELTGSPLPNLAERWAIVAAHVVRMHEFYGDATGVRIARKHVRAYFDTLLPVARAAAAKASFMRLTSARTQLAALTREADAALERRGALKMRRANNAPPATSAQILGDTSDCSNHTASAA